MTKADRKAARKQRRDRRAKKHQLAVCIVENLIAKNPTAKELATFRRLFPSVAKKLEDPKDE